MEADFQRVQNPYLIISHKGKKNQAGIATSFEQGRNFAVCCAMSTNGLL
jgi:hypothetical protein